MRTVPAIGTIALALLSAACLGSSSAQPALTSANLARAMRAHGFTNVKAIARPGLGCEALTPKGSHLVGGPGRFEAIGDLNVKPLNLPHATARTGAVLVVVSNPDTAAQCAKQMLATDYHSQLERYSKSLTSDMIEAPNTGGPGSLPLKQDGVVTDGSFQPVTG